MSEGPARREHPLPAPEAADVAVTVDRLAWGGDGVGRHGGKVVFVPMTAPGGRALVSVEASRRSWCRGRLLRLVTAGPGRVEPCCPLFGDCGG